MEPRIDYLLKPNRIIKKERHKLFFFDKYSMGKRIGHGIYGNVHICYNKSNNNNNSSNKLVVKTFSINNIDNVMIKNEILILKKLRNYTHIINLIYHGKCKMGYFYLVFEKCVMNLNTFMENGLTYLSDDIAVEICLQITKGLEYCHLNGIIHGDLKLDNILIGEDGTIKLCDFGLSVINKNKNKKNIKNGNDYGNEHGYGYGNGYKNGNENYDEKNENNGNCDEHYDEYNATNDNTDDNNGCNSLTPDKYAIVYRPLEFTLLNVFNYYSDVWALGCIIHEIFFGFLLFDTSKCRSINIKNCTFLIFDTLGKFDQTQLNIYSGSFFFKKILEYAGTFYDELNLHKEQRESLFINKQHINEFEIKIYKILNECMNYNYWERITCTELLKLFKNN